MGEALDGWRRVSTPWPVRGAQETSENQPNAVSRSLNEKRECILCPSQTDETDETDET